MDQVNRAQCRDGLASADALGGSSHDEAIDRWLTGIRLTTLEEFRQVWSRLDANSKRLREEGRKLREKLSGNG